MWKARNAWQCALAMFIADIVTTLMVRLAWKHGSSSEWLTAHESSVNLALKFYRAGLWLFFAFWFSGDRSVLGFAQKIGLMRRPNLTGWLAAWASVGLGLFAWYGTASGWTSPNQVARGFAAEGGLASWAFFLFVISVGPFYEEVVQRGFLYPAFRGSYGRLLSAGVVLLVGAYFHSGVMMHSMFSTVCLLLLWIFLCTLRERTGVVWNCVLCHAAYNAAQTWTWPVYVAGLILLFPICIEWSKNSAKNGKGSSQ